MLSKLRSGFDHTTGTRKPGGACSSPMQSASPAAVFRLHRQKVPAKSCTPRMANTNNDRV